MIKEIVAPKLKNPILIAAWPGMGEVAYRSVLFLREAMGFKMFAKLEAEEFFRPAAVTVEKGEIDLPSLPAGFFYYLKGENCPDMVLFLGEAQPPLEYAETLAFAIVDFLKKYKVQFIFTFAAKPEAIDHKNDSLVWIAATHEDVLQEFKKFKLKVLKKGQISGLNGIVLGTAKRKGIKGVCLLGEIPFYTVQIENPKACANVLKVVSEHLQLKLNLSPLQERGKFVEEEIDKLISHIKGEEQAAGTGPLSEEDIDKIKKDLATYTKLPQSAREKIENLIKEARTDITKANKLKDELDHWNVYKEYEDRFLDLFKKKKKKGKDPH
ncbi:MAG: PAC2 family protein [Candidatus Omnitrophota bacterium]|nr:MAG: PAC2 family protein [Candidatus Omnitrophota bacterium]